MTQIELNGIKTRTSRYVAHDGREMAVLLMEDYRRLLKLASGDGDKSVQGPSAGQCDDILGRSHYNA